MGFKRTSEGRVFFSGSADVSNDEGGKTVKKATNLSGDKPKAPASPGTQLQVLSLLKSLNEKLQLSQLERKTMRQELESYRHLIEKLESKTSAAEETQERLQEKLSQDTHDVKKAETTAKTALKELEEARRLFLKLEDRTERADRSVSDLLQRSEKYREVTLAMSKKQADLERKYNEQKGMMAREMVSYDDLVERLSLSEQKQIAIESQFKNTVSNQDSLVQKIDKEIESRARFMRKIEHIEQTVLLTQDTLSKGQGPIVDQGKGNYLPSYLLEEEAEQKKAVPLSAKIAQIIREPVNVNVPLMALGGLVFVLGGWAISATQKPDLSQFYDKYSIETLVQQPVSSQQKKAEPWSTSEDISGFVAPAGKTAAQGVPSVQQQDKMFEQMEASSDDIAAQLNAIEPGQIEQQEPIQTQKTIAAQARQQVAVPLETFTEIEEHAVKAGSYVDPDTSLPQSVKDIEALAIKGVPEAQHDLAAIYVTGHAGIQQDYARAAYWFDKAAQGGVANAGYNLGVLYHQGLGVEQNIESAMHWYTSAAENGHAEAQYNLGIAYIEGIGVAYDPATASMHFESAAKNGVTEAAYNLGLIYENGLLGIPKPDEALAWYKIAADAGSPEANAALKQLADSLGITTKEIERIVEDVQKSKNIGAIRQDKPSVKAPKATRAKVDPLVEKTVPTLREPISSIETDKQTLVMVQKNLMRLGLYPGPADGKMGPLTRDSIRSYQSMHKLKGDAYASQSLLDHMKQR